MSGPRDRAGSTAMQAGPDALAVCAGAGLLLLAGLAWAWTVAMAAMPDCHRIGVPAFLGMWTVMMAAMMFPAMIPVVTAFVMLARARDAAPMRATIGFVASYLVVWALLGVPAELVLATGGRLVAAMPALARAGGVILVLCGLYQLTPLKDACLRHCRMPHLFLGQHWRDGLGGAVRLGAYHAVYCAGCCASLMIVLLVVGVMNLAWMVALSGLISLEKIVPRGALLGRLAGVALGAAGVARLVA